MKKAFVLTVFFGLFTILVSFLPLNIRVFLTPPYPTTQATTTAIDESSVEANADLFVKKFGVSRETALSSCKFLSSVGVLKIVDMQAEITPEGIYGVQITDSARKIYFFWMSKYGSIENVHEGNKDGEILGLVDDGTMPLPLWEWPPQWLTEREMS